MDGNHRRPLPPVSALPPTPQGVADPSRQDGAYSAAFQTAAAQQRVQQAAAAFAGGGGGCAHTLSVTSGCGSGATPEGGSPTSGVYAPLTAPFGSATAWNHLPAMNGSGEAREPPSPPARDPVPESPTAAAQDLHENMQQVRFLQALCD